MSSSSTPKRHKVRVTYPLCIGEYTPSNTVTGRTGQPLWLTVPEPTPTKAGSELMNKVQSPPGYVFVGFDFAAQELVLFSLMGDSKHGSPGSTPMSQAVLNGSKERGTDYPSVLAKEASISRADAKTAVYASLYGTGSRSLGRRFWAANKKRDMKDCLKDAESFLKAMRGTRVKGTRMHVGGTASDSFNKVAQIVHSEYPSECALHRVAPSPCRPNVVGNDFMTARGNFPIQAAAASMLHIVLTEVAHGANATLSRDDWWLSHTVHDSVTYCVRLERVEVFKELLRKAHEAAWSCVCYNLGLGEDVPESIRYPSEIVVGRVWGKQGKATRTITSEEGL